MAIIVEDGSIVTGANSYVTEAELTAYVELRGGSVVAGDREKWLTLSMDYLETLDFIGTKSDEDQPLQWPRDGAYVDGYLLSETAIPEILKKAQLNIAKACVDGYNPLAVIDRATKSETVDVISVVYQDNASAAAVVPTINAMLKKLLRAGGNSGYSFTVSKA